MLDQCLVSWMCKDIDVPDVRTRSLRTRTGSQSPVHLQDRIMAGVLGNRVPVSVEPKENPGEGGYPLLTLLVLQRWTA